MLKMRFARANNKIVDAFEEVKLGKRKLYDCALCDHSHSVHLVQAQHKRYCNPAWFAHNGDTGQSGGANTVAHAHSGSGGESEIHLHAKFLLQKYVGRYFFTHTECITCGKLDTIQTQNCIVHLEENDPTAAYRYDAMLHDRLGALAVMEVWYTHKTSLEKRKHVRSRKLAYAEFDAEHVIQKLDKLHTQYAIEPVQLDNLRVRTIECDMCVCVEAWKNELERVKWHEKYLAHGFAIYSQNIIDTIRREQEITNKRLLDQQVMLKKQKQKRMAWLKRLWPMMACNSGRITLQHDSDLNRIHLLGAMQCDEMEYNQSYIDFYSTR